MNDHDYRVIDRWRANHKKWLEKEERMTNFVKLKNGDEFMTKGRYELDTFKYGGGPGHPVYTFKTTHGSVIYINAEEVVFIERILMREED